MKGLVPRKGVVQRLGFERVCRVAKAHELDVQLWASPVSGTLTLVVGDGADGRSTATAKGAEQLDLAAARVLGKLAEAGIR